MVKKSKIYFSWVTFLRWRYYSSDTLGGNIKEKIKNAYLLIYERITPFEPEEAQKPTEPEQPKKKSEESKVSFKVGDHAVYPSHGIGKIADIETTPILGKDFKCYLMYFEKEKLTIKIPVSSADKIGLRHLISKSQMDEVFSILRSGVKKLKGM